MGVLGDEDLHGVSLVNLAAICRKVGFVKYKDTRTRTLLHAAIEVLTEEERETIVDELRQAVVEGVTGYKRKRVNQISHNNKRQKICGQGETPIQDTDGSDSKHDTVIREYGGSGVEEGISTGEDQGCAASSADRIKEIIDSDFLRPPTKEEIDEVTARFIDATSNQALQTGACSSCARESSIRELVEMDIDKIPNKDMLKPHTPHPAHVLTAGILLYDKALYLDDRKTRICRECLLCLKSEKRPKFSLANNMWIGDVPAELKGLSLAERLLIAKYYPSAYVVKLYPKHKRAKKWDKKLLYDGLKGNVSTYKLNPKDVAPIIDGETYPPSPKILSATIGVTFVGPKGRIAEVLPRDIARVRRKRIRSALQWLKINNPIYADITISEDNLASLPEDGIPEEILLVAKQSEDTEALGREHNGYIPDEEDEANVRQQEDIRLQEALNEAGLVEVNDEDECSVPIEPCIVPLQSLGVIDIEGADISASELMAHALSNACQPKGDEDFVIRRGSAFINEYARIDPKTKLRNDGGPSNPNHLLGCFPTLFPYGAGGVETDRPIKLPYETHVRWSMNYWDRRFRKDPQYMFQVFGVMQKRQVCRSASLQMKKSTFKKNIDLIHTLTPADLIQASKEEARNVRFSNPAVRALRQELSAVRTKVQGTDESRHSVRSKIWATNLVFNPPTLWVTVNPADTQDPIAQVLTGAEIDLDAFCSTAGPDVNDRAKNIAGDPFAAAQYFNMIITLVLGVLFGVNKSPSGRIDRTYGAIGKVQSYIGTVEAQGRGTLHLHTLIWLKDAPSSKEIKEALKSEAFREKLKEYVGQVIKADIDGRTTEEVKDIPKITAVSYSRPIDPRSSTTKETKAREKELVRALQFHVCDTERCLSMLKGRLKCKRRAPFQTAGQDWVDEIGNWGPKRICEFLNNWNPCILNCGRCNHDLKLILSGMDTATITYYITNYATKKQQKSSNISALLAERLAFIRGTDKKQKDLNAINKRLIQRCANSLARYREFSAPEIMTYINGWPDIYELHNYVSLYWDSAMRALRSSIPSLWGETAQTKGGAKRQTKVDNPENNDVQGQQCTVQVVDGTVSLRDQLRDYRYRGQELEHMSLYEFVENTYEGEETEERMEGQSKAGRPPNQRSKYKPEAGKGKKCRVMRVTGHETIVRFVGKWFPRNDGPTAGEEEIYAASMLLLLHPWRKIEHLKPAEGTFKTKLSNMLSSASKKTHTIVENIQYYYECADGAKEHRELERNGETSQLQGEFNLEIDEDDLELMKMDRESWEAIGEVTEDDIRVARMTRVAKRELHFGDMAMMEATDAGIFNDEQDDIPEWIGSARTPEDEEFDKIRVWEKQLKDTTRNMVKNGIDITSGLQNEEEGLSETEIKKKRHVNEVEPSIERIIQSQTGNEAQGEPTRPKLQMLNKEQRRAHDIVERKLKDIIEGRESEPLKMLILGQGGTGKSMLISAITESFAFHGKEDILAKCATTGIAATDIGGRTLHSWAALAIKNRNADWTEQRGEAVSKDKRRMHIIGKEFLIIDEISMADKTDFFNTSQIAGYTRASEFKGSAEDPFGGMNVILTGDFHQFPPVGNSSGALYVDKKDDKANAKLGRAIFKQFNKVVILTEQVRVKDHVWMNILDKIRIGDCDENDIQEIRQLVLSNPDCKRPDFSLDPWREAILVTSRHSVREKWNEKAIIKHSFKTGNIRYTFPSEDFMKDTGDKLNMEARLAVAQLDEKKTGKLKDELQITKGMKAMVLLNLAIEADIANGTRGQIYEIVLDEREDKNLVPIDGHIHLQYPPMMILFKPDKASNVEFEGIPKGLIPLTSSESSFTVRGADNMTYKIRRRQYAMTAGYAFTDYKSQGQTLEYVIIDLASPPTGRISPFAAYVALSRSRGRNTIRLLREFDEEIFQHHPSEDLRKEMIRFQQLNEITKEDERRRRGGSDTLSSDIEDDVTTKDAEE